MPDAISRLSELSDDELDALIDIAQARAEGALTRRDLLKMGGGLAAAGVLGGSAVGSVSADASTSDGDWNLGEPGNRGDVFADAVDSEQQNDVIVCKPADDAQNKLDKAIADDKPVFYTAGTHSLASSLTAGSSADDVVIKTAGYNTEFDSQGDFPIFDFTGTDSDTLTYVAIRGYPVLNGGGKSNTSAHGVDAEFVTHLQLEIGDALNCRDAITLKDVWQAGIDADIDSGSAAAGTSGNYRGLVTREPTSADPKNTALEISRLFVQGTESWGFYAPHLSGTKIAMLEVADCGEGVSIGDPSNPNSVEFVHAGIILVDSITGSNSLRVAKGSGVDANLMRFGHIWTASVPVGPEFIDADYIIVDNIISTNVDSDGLVLDGVKTSVFNSGVVLDASQSGAGVGSGILHKSTNRGTGKNVLTDFVIVGGNHDHAVDEQGGAAVASYNRYGGFQTEGGGSLSLASGSVFNQATSEIANAETPQRTDLLPGEIIDFTDTGDGTGTGLYLKKQDGTFVEISTV